MHNKNTLFVGKVLRRFPVLSSTQDYAAEWLISSAPAEGAVVVAGHQTAGRGQMGNTWEAAPDRNLTMSVILFPTFLQAPRQFLLSQAVAVGISDAIAAHTGAPVQIKWPNDLMVGQQKVGGILIQNILSGVLIQSSIVGIGLNVNQAAFPPELPQAGSLSLACDRTFDLENLMFELFSCLESRYLQLRQKRADAVEAAYLEYLFQRGVLCRYSRAGGEVFTGRIIDVETSGRLRLETERGIESFGVKEVKYLFD